MNDTFLSFDDEDGDAAREARIEALTAEILANAKKKSEAEALAKAGSVGAADIRVRPTYLNPHNSQKPFNGKPAGPRPDTPTRLRSTDEALADLANRSIWVGWRQQTRNGHLTKVPYDPRTGGRAKSDNAATWATRAEAELWTATQRGDGVGIMLSELDGGAFLCGVDLDTCRDPETGDSTGWAQEIIDRFATYTEISPSGTGVKLFFTVTSADLAAVETLLDGKHGRAFKNGGGEHPPAIEIYCGERYFAVTEESCGSTDSLRRVDLADLQWLIREAGPKFAGKSGNGRDDSRSAGKSGNGKDNSRSAKAFRAGAALKESGASYEATRDALLEHQDPEIAEWAHTKGMANDERELRRIFDKAGGEAAVRLEDFVAYMQSPDYVYLPAGDFWPAARVDARLPPVPLFDKSGKPVVNDKTGEQKEMRASAWLAKHAPVEQMTWVPGQPQLIRNKLTSDGGWTDQKGATVLNLYRPPTIAPGDATKAEPWIKHVRTIYPDEASHIIGFLAHRVRRPHEKINHGLVLGGLQGIGKDTLLEPVKHAVGQWNFAEVSPQQMLGRFNGFLKSVVLRISEAKDMGEFDRFKFYAHTKTILAAPPDTLRVDEKHLREHSVFNVCGVVMTTNHKTDGIFLSADDRRHFVAWSEATKGDFTEAYWNDLWKWYERGGFGHVAAYLAELDLAGFNPKAPPPKTPAFWAIVDANRAPEDAELADVLDAIAKDAVTLDMLIAKAEREICEWLRERKNRRAIPHRLEQCGYVPVHNDTAESGLFVINGKRQTVYAKASLSVRDQLQAARKLTSP